MAAVYACVASQVGALALIFGYFKGWEISFGEVVGAVLLQTLSALPLIWLGCHAYNWLARRFGGVVIMLADPD